MINSIPLTILVCTHNTSSSIYKLLTSIIQSSVCPSHIIIVGTSPSISEYIPSIPSCCSLSYIYSPISNQIVQRLIGIPSISTEFVLQCDDDLEFDFHCISHLYDFISHNPKAVASPIGLNPDGSLWSQRWVNTYKSSFLFRAYLKMIHGWTLEESPPQSILKSGMIIPLTSFPVSAISHVDWLHSCRIQRTSACYELQYSLYEGKSYFEDVYSSLQLASLNYDIVLLSSALIVHPVVPPLSPTVQLSLLSHQLKLSKSVNGSTLLAIIETLLLTLIRLISLIFSDRYHVWHRRSSST